MSLSREYQLCVSVAGSIYRHSTTGKEIGFRIYPYIGNELEHGFEHCSLLYKEKKMFLILIFRIRWNLNLYTSSIYICTEANNWEITRHKVSGPKLVTQFKTQTDT